MNLAIFILALSICSAAAGPPPPYSVCSPYFRPLFPSAAAGGGGGGGLTSPTLDERFDATGYDLTSWSEVLGAGTINEDYTTSPAPLEGAQSLHMTQGGFDATYIARSITANANQLFYFMMRPVSISGDDELLTIWSGGGSTKEGQIIFLSDGTLRVDLLDGSPVATVDAMSVGTTYHVYVSYAGAGKTMTIGFSTDGTRPTTGNKFATETVAGDADTIDTVGAFGHSAFNGGTSETIFDKWQQKTGTTW